MTDEMKAIINSKEKHIVVQAYAGCFPKDTQYFNGIEWKSIEEYIDDLVLQYDPLNIRGELTKPLKFIKRKNDTGWYSLSLSGGKNIVCTGSHIILCYDYENNIYNIPAMYLDKEIYKKDYYILSFENSKYYLGNNITPLTYRKILDVKKIDLEEDYEYCFTVQKENLILKQNDLIFSTHNCGKSSTMLEYVKSNPSEKILFMVFNKEMQLDFAKRLKGVKHNCKVTTIHSLAYRWYLSQGYDKKILRNISIIDIKNILNTKIEYEKLSKIMFYFNMYLSSRFNTPNELIPLKPEDTIYFKYVDRLWEYFRVYSDFMPHNVYLKMYQLAKVKLDYETIIIDEFNDCSDVMLDLVLTNLDKKIIAVGDSQQAIMSFSFCIDGLTELKDNYGFKEYTLTNSFRVSETIANIASRYLSFMKEKSISFHGLSETKIGRLNLLEADANTNQIHLLCRTKIGGLKEISELLDKDDSKKIYYVGGLEGFGIKEIEKVLAYNGYAYIGRERFHINTLRAMLKKGVEDPEISRICAIYSFVEKNEDMIDIIKKTEVKKKEDADIIVLTSHVSKGLTLENTLLGRDFPPIEDIKMEIKKSKDRHKYIYNIANAEANLCYVAMTRATGILDFGNTFTKKELLKEDSKIKVETEYDVFLK